MRLVRGRLRRGARRDIGRGSSACATVTASASAFVAVRVEKCRHATQRPDAAVEMRPQPAAALMDDDVADAVQRNGGGQGRD
ncbi:hypothetical protein [Burkholderia pseudomultivorans]|uniref:hypothetical protein n=1 Tax=Burkholderia pseudomultivorans TaxID=1207504 RepID=UPI0012DA3912|nr:hypothetical protein [Burkholderia pseudomultivorans]